MNINKFLELSKKHLKKKYRYYQTLPQSGSERIYLRLFFNDFTLIGVYNQNIQENRAFINLSKAFLKSGLKVPKVLAVDDTEQYYILTDHGNTTLYDYLLYQNVPNLTPELIELFQKSINFLIEFQLCGHQKNFYRNCNYPKKFDKRAVLWDLNYFKYNFLKLTEIKIDEFLLENDFEKLSKKIEKIEMQGFMYRDFQSRNIMIDNGELVFIDFQGGRKGPMHYDIISLLWQARINLSPLDREKLLDYYIQTLETKLPNSRQTFIDDFNYVLILRLIQVLGAYGFRGLIEKKSLFLTSIYTGIIQLSDCWNKIEFDIEYPELGRCIKQIRDLAPKYAPSSNRELIINITSFSFLQGGYPADLNGHGGGFVFDCRGLPNPGRFDKLKKFTGLDKEVVEFFNNEPDMKVFIDRCFEIILQHINNYIERNFKNINVSFGCTGGKHRSVFCADTLNNMLNERGIKTVIFHREQKQLNKY